MPYCCGYWYDKDSHCSKCNGRKKLLVKKYLPRELGEEDINEFDELPEYALKWLADRGITYYHIKKYNLQYCYDLKVDGKTYGERLIIPASNDWWQGRCLFNTKPKYISPIKKKDYFYRADFENSDSIVVTEDVLSAIRVAEYDNVVALQGNYINGELVGLILSKYPVVKLWLDNDKGGIDGVLRFKQQYASLCDIVTVINYKEPKLCSEDELKEILNDNK